MILTDTDSLLYHIKTEDIYKDMLDHLDLFDTSDFDKDHFLYSNKNKKIVGKMKDETHGIPIEEFVGLRPKMYSVKYKENGMITEKKTAKSIVKHVTKREITHEDYKDCLFNGTRTMANMSRIQSFGHEMYCVNINKIGLSPFDDKRYILDDGIITLAYGHKATRFTEEDMEIVNMLLD